MVFRSLDEMQIWQDARELARAISEILDRPRVKRDRRLAEQLGDSSSSVFSNVSEGFGQRSDKAFARYLEIARSSNNEAIAQLTIARFRRHLTDEELSTLQALSTRLGKRMTRLIQYLERGNPPGHRGGQR